MITNIFLLKLRNAEFFQFGTDISSILNGYNLNTLAINKPFEAFTSSFQKIDSLFKLNRGSTLTEDITLLDERRDKAINGILLYLESMTLYFDGNINKSATLILNQLKSYGSGIARQNYQTETATITNIIKDWDTKPEYSQAISLLKLTDWKSELAQANTLFNSLYIERAKDNAENITSETMKEKRQEATMAWKKLKTAIESHYNIKKIEETGYEPYEVVINNINSIIDKYNILIANRS